MAAAVTTILPTAYLFKRMTTEGFRGDNLDMLGEKNLMSTGYNPITESSVTNGSFFILWTDLVTSINVLAGGVAAAVTGQEYTVTDMIAAGLAGIFAGGLDLKELLQVAWLVLSIRLGAVLEEQIRLQQLLLIQELLFYQLFL